MKRLFTTSILITSAYILSALVRTFIVQVYYIPTVSMEPSLYVNDRVLVVKQNIIDQNLETGDIVVFYPAETELKDGIDLFIDSLNIVKLVNQEFADVVYIKRIVGKGGDRIRISENGKIFVNEIQDNRYVIENISLAEQIDLTIPNNQYFLLGDNVENSIDSRSFGPINKENIVGKAVIKLYPINKISRLND